MRAIEIDRRRVSPVLLLVTAWAGLSWMSALAQTPPTHKDVVYATVDGKELALDLYMPAGVRNRRCVVWVHGGRVEVRARRRGRRWRLSTTALRRRASTSASPARPGFRRHVHDIKAAIRFLRAKAGDHGYRADRIAIAGSSSGGHLAALVGVTNGHKELEGSVGTDLKQSSDIAAIIDYYGASNLTTILAQSTPFGLNMRRPALELLLGALPDQAKTLAELASPVTHVDRTDPPLLIFHGDQDPQMPINQSHELQGAYEKAGLDVYFDVVHGAAHGGDQFFSPARVARAVAFLRRTIGQ